MPRVRKVSDPTRLPLTPPLVPVDLEPVEKALAMVSQLQEGNAKQDARLGAMQAELDGLHAWNDSQAKLLGLLERVLKGGRDAIPPAQNPPAKNPRRVAGAHKAWRTMHKRQAEAGTWRRSRSN